MLLSVRAWGGAFVGVVHSSATTTVTLSIPSLYGINIPEEEDSVEAGGFRLASLKQGEADHAGFRFAVLSTVGEGKATLRRLVRARASETEESLSHAGNRFFPEGAGTSSALFLANSFGWKNFEDRVSPSRLGLASRGKTRDVSTVVYELWQF
jgi:hypothetical protein